MSDAGDQDPSPVLLKLQADRLAETAVLVSVMRRLVATKVVTSADVVRASEEIGALLEVLGENLPAPVLASAKASAVRSLAIIGAPE